MRPRPMKPYVLKLGVVEPKLRRPDGTCIAGGACKAIACGGCVDDGGVNDGVERDSWCQRPEDERRGFMTMTMVECRGQWEESEENG